MFKRTLFFSSMLMSAAGLWAQAPAAPAAKELNGNEAVPFPTKDHPTVCRGHVTGRNAVSVPLVVPPGKQVKAQLGGRFAGELKVRFVNNIRSHKDPGLMVDATNFRNDVSYYKNVTNEPQTIFCTVRSIETDVPQIMPEFTITFTEGA
ncbi:hypothetical protein GETHLI_03470 [Geothrix limicola]|uniref:Secreted protein n=1 Tax=Geothrix limicola TaxID=2927978 RepID=A0ABQ5QAJ2_9BACT|nr:hypothetical protein [Geothrix limicola]GLH71845.1 hypothetical protein GETHLI_03470 [Geothrix limicola]